MKEFQIPPPVTIPADQLREGVPPVWTFALVCRDIVWTDPKWREDREMFLRYKSLHSKISEAQPGDTVQLSDIEHETFLPILAQKGKNLPPGGLSHALMLLMEPVLFARDVKEPAPEARREEA